MLYKCTKCETWFNEYEIEMIYPYSDNLDHGFKQCCSNCKNTTFEVFDNED